MRITYDGGSRKTTPYCIEITARPDARRAQAEIEAQVFWADDAGGHSARRVSEICRQREADSVYSELLAMLAHAEIYPTPSEADELHELIAQVCLVVKAA